MAVEWEAEVAALLNELSDVQGELLQVLERKRALLVSGDPSGIESMQADEQNLLDRLQACHERRTALLSQAAADGRPSDSIGSLTASLPRVPRATLGRQVQEAQSRARILQHNSLTNWVLAQRALIHLSQMLEIIATGGRLQPTYGSGPSSSNSGSLVDQAA